MTGMMLLLSCTSLNDIFLREVPAQLDEAADVLVGPPRLECDASALEFSALSVTEAASETLTLSCSNPGTGSVEINNLVTSSDTFSRSFSSTTIAPGGVLTISVTFTPTHNALFSDSLVLFTDSLSTAELTISLSGTGLAPEVSVTPEDFSFGAVMVGCEASSALSVANIGTEDLAVTDLQLPAPFALDASVMLPWSIAPGGQHDVTLHYTPEDVHSSSEVLTVTTSDPLSATLFVSVMGSGLHAGEEQHDVFFQSAGMHADTLFAVSDSVLDDLDGFREEFATFVDTLAGLGVEYRVAILVSDTGVVAGADDYIDDPVNATSQAIVMLDEQSSNGGETLALLLAGMEANDDWLREGRLNLIGISDEADHSSLPYGYYVGSFQTLVSDPANVVVHGIGGDYPGGCGMAWDVPAYTGMYEATESTDGAFYSLCTDDWAALMIELALDTAPVTDHFRLTQPAVPDTIALSIDGSAVTSGWSYSDADQAVFFSTPPGPGAQVDVTYEILACP